MKQKIPSTPKKLDLKRYSIGIGSVLAAGSAADGSIVHVTTPIKVAGDGGPAQLVPWDVDGDTTPDFNLVRDNSFNTDYHDFLLKSVNSNNGIVQSTSVGPGRINNLPTSFTIGPTLPGGYVTYNAASSNPNRLLLIYSGNAMGSATGLGGVGFADGVPGLMGFQFQISGQTHYGWARLEIDAGSPSSADTGLFITEWAYQSTPNTAIGAGVTSAVPEPATNATLGLLALGAAGVAQYRRKRNADKEGATTE